VRFSRQRTTDEIPDEAVEPDETEVAERSRAYTPGKGRPTPKRREAENRRRGPVTAPKTQREANKRSSVSREDRRKEAAERRERMAAGDERYLLPRDKGPVRAYVRNIVDSRRHLIGLFMPLAVLVLVAMISPVPAIRDYSAPGTAVVLLVMVIEGVLLSRTVVRKVRAKFPDAPDRSLSLGWYSFIRASQIRKLRLPKPLVKPGDEV
jgi:hypothetical protein